MNSRKVARPPAVTGRRIYKKPAIASFPLEERFTALTHLVSGLGADVRRVELEVHRQGIELERHTDGSCARGLLRRTMLVLERELAVGHDLAFRSDLEVLVRDLKKELAS